MRKAFLVMVLLMSVVLYPATMTSSGIDVTGFENLYDPQGDVYKMVDGEMTDRVSGYSYLDILRISAYEETELTVKYLSLEMEVVGNIAVSTDINYIFVIGTSNDEAYVLFSNASDRGDLTCMIINIETGEMKIVPDVSASGSVLRIRIRLGALGPIGNPSRLEAFRAAAVDNSDPVTKIGDMAPDKLARITSPSHGATIWYDSPTPGTYTFEGVCRKSQDNFKEVNIQLGTQQETITGSDITTWSATFDIGDLSGSQTLELRATDVQDRVFEDSITFTVNNGYHSGPRPTTPSFPDMTVGDTFRYGTRGNPQLSNLDLSVTTDMEMRVEKVETIMFHGQERTCINVHTSQKGSVVLGAFDMEQTVNRDSWRPVDEHQSIMKEYTMTTQSIMMDGAPLNTMYTYTNMTYNQPFNPGYDAKSVGRWWSSSATGVQETKVVDADGSVETRESTPSSTVYQEVLSTASISEQQVPALSATQPGFLVKSSNGDNESAYTVMTFVSGFPVPVMIDAYDGNREKIGSLYLQTWVKGTGIFADISGIQWPSEKLSEGQEYVFSVEVQNQGDREGSIWASLHVDGTEVDKDDIELNAGDSGIIDLSWTPTKPGKYFLEIRTADSYETRTIDVEAVESTLDDSTFILLGILAIVGVLVLLVALKRKGGKKDVNDEPKETPLPDESAYKEAESGVSIEGLEITGKSKTNDPLGSAIDSMAEKMTVKCGKCDSITHVSVTSKPYRFKCPECGAKLLLR